MSPGLTRRVVDRRTGDVIGIRTPDGLRHLELLVRPVFRHMRALVTVLARTGIA